MCASRCVWGSMPPGMTSLPAASSVRALSGACMQHSKVPSGDLPCAKLVRRTHMVMAVSVRQN